MARESAEVLELRRALGRALAACREGAGWSQRELANRLHYHRTAICHLEAGRHAAPPEFWERADTLLGADGALLTRYHDLAAALRERTAPGIRPHVSHAGGGENAEHDHDPVLSAPWTAAGTVESAVVLKGGDSRVKRRVFLSLTGPALTAPAHQWLIHEPEPLLAGLFGRRVSAELVHRLTAMIAELRRMDDVAGGGSVLALAEQEFGWVAGLLNEASYDQPTGRALHVALAELGQLCGWGAFDAGHYGLAQRYNIAALRAAHSAEDRPLGAHILGSMAKQAAHQGKPAEATTLVDTALTGTRSHRSPRLLAELHLRQAYSSATLRDTSGCAAAISKALNQIEHLNSGGDPPWLYWVDPAWVTVETGDCLLRSGQTDRAIVMLDEGVALFDEPFVRDRQLYTVHLADALARPGKQQDLDSAADRGLAAIQLAESLDSTLGITLIHDLYHRMKPHAKNPAVQDFLQHAQALTRIER